MDRNSLFKCRRRALGKSNIKRVGHLMDGGDVVKLFCEMNEVATKCATWFARSDHGRKSKRE
jgi:hypothetical protein